MLTSILEKLRGDQEPLLKKTGFTIPAIEYDTELAKQLLADGHPAFLLLLQALTGDRKSGSLSWFHSLEKPIIEAFFSNRRGKNIDPRLITSLRTTCGWKEDNIEDFFADSGQVVDNGFSIEMAKAELGSRAIMARIINPEAEPYFGYYYREQKGLMDDRRTPHISVCQTVIDIVLGKMVIKITPFAITSKNDVEQYLFPDEPPSQTRFIDTSPGSIFVTSKSYYAPTSYLTMVNLDKSIKVSIEGKPLHVWVEKPTGLSGKRAPVKTKSLFLPKLAQALVGSRPR